MSQIIAFDSGIIGATTTITGNVGGAVSPDGAGNIGFTGSGEVTVTGTPGTNSLDITLSSEFTTTSVEGWNGCFIEKVSGAVTSDGVTITVAIEKAGTGDLTVIFSDGFYDWDTTPADTVTLTAGSDTSPQVNYVYFLQSTKALTVSTAGWPSAEHAPIGKILCPSAALTQTDGPYALHSHGTDVRDTINMGHLTHISEWIRSQNATWISGVTPTLIITPQGAAADDVIFTNTSGIILQIEEKNFPIFAGTPDMYVVNDSVTAYNKITNMNTLLTDSTGGTLSGKYFSLVVWGAVSGNGIYDKLYVNLPGGSYSTASTLEKDFSKYADYSIPSEFKGTGFLIAQFNLRHQTASSGTWTLMDTQDLRGLFPSLAAGGVTANAAEFKDNTFRILDDGDNTKELAFQISGLTTGTVRTITMDDRDIDLDAVPDSFSTDSGTATPAAGIATIAGGSNISTTGAGSTATVNLSGTTDHAVQLGNAGGSLTSLGLGTATHVLTSAGAGADPTWETPTVGTVTSVSGGTNITDSGTATDPVLDLDAAITLTTVNATTFDTNVATAAVTLAGTSLLADGTDTNIDLNITAKGTGQVIIDDLQLTTDLAVTEGGTGVSTLTDHGVLLGSGAAAVTALGEATDGQLVIGNTGADPTLATLTAGTGIDITDASGSITITNTVSTSVFKPTVWTLTTEGGKRYIESDRVDGFITHGYSGVIKYSDTSDLTTWTIASTNPFSTGYKLNASYFSSGTWVIGGEQGQLGYSTDNGDVWTLVTSSFSTTNIYGVAHGNGNWVAVADYGKLASSTTYSSGWTQRTTPTSSDLKAVFYGNSIWVAVGSSGRVITATDPTGTWTQRTSGVATTLYKVFYGNGLFVAVGSTGTLITSPDGITWTSRTSSFGTDALYTVYYANGYWLAGGQNGKIATSTDGITWNQLTTEISSGDVFGIGYADGYWVTKGIQYSSDILVVTKGGTGISTLTDHGVLLGSGTGAITPTAVGATNQVLLGSTGADPTWGAVDLTTDITGTLPIANGGTGATTLTDHGVLLGSGTGAVTALGEATDGQLVIGDTGGDPILATLTEGAGIDITNSAGSVTIANLLTINNQTGTAYTTVLTDSSKYITMNNAAASTLTIPPNSSVAYPIGTTIYVQQLGAGQVTLTQGSGVTFRSADNSYKLAVQYSICALTKILSDTWGISGDVSI